MRGSALRPLRILQIFCSAEEVLELSSDDNIITKLTSAWKVAVARENCRLQNVWANPGKSQPEKRLLPPAILVPRQHRTQYVQSGLRQLCLDAMFQIAVATGSQNLAFGQDLVMAPDQCRPLFDRSFQAVTEDRLQAHRRVFKRWVQWRHTHVPRDVHSPSPVFILAGGKLRRPHCCSCPLRVLEVVERESWLAVAN